MCTLSFVLKSLRTLGLLFGSYCCSSYGVANTFSSLGPFSSSSIETLCSVQWLAVCIPLCICQALAKPLKRELYLAPVSKHFLASTIVPGFVNCIWDGSTGGAVYGYPFFYSLLHTLYFFPWVFCTPCKKHQSIHTFVFFLLELHVVCELYLGYSELLG